MRDVNWKIKKFTGISRVFSKRESIILLEVLDENRDGLTFKELRNKIYDKKVNPGSYRNLSYTLRRLRHYGFVTKRRRYEININMATTRVMARNPKLQVY